MSAPKESDLSARLFTVMCKLYGVADWLRGQSSEISPINHDEVKFGQGEIVAVLAEEIRVIRDEIEGVSDAAPLRNDTSIV